MILMISIYLLVGILIADRRGHFLGRKKGINELLRVAAVILFWPLIVGVIYIDIIDQAKKNRGM